MQLMQVYVQKSMSTTRPFSDASERGRFPGVLNQSSVSMNSGAAPSVGSSVRDREQGRLAGVGRGRVDGGGRAFARGGSVRRGELGLVTADLVQPAGHGARALKRRREVDVGDVLGDELIEAHVLVGQDRKRRDDHDRAEHALQQRPAPGGSRALEQPAASEGEGDIDPANITLTLSDQTAGHF